MNVAFITTVDHNVGDDFVREGIIYLLRRHFKGVKVRAENIHKHAPVTVRHGFEWVRSRRASCCMNWLPVWLSRDRVLEADLLVQSGAPVYWCHGARNSHCADNEWYNPLIRRRYRRVKKSVPFINLAAGSAFPYDSDGTKLLRCRKDVRYIRELHAMSAVTTVRDKLAKRILNSIGLSARALPCSSIFAGDNLGVERGDADFVALNYMRGGGHFGFDQDIDVRQWEKTFREFYRQIRRQHRCVFVCHGRAEVVEAKKVAPGAEVFVAKSSLEYLKMYARARFGIMNRVHGALAIASFGRPAFVVGTDTRAHMVEEVGLRHAFVEDVDVDRLKTEFSRLQGDADTYAERFSKFKRRAREGYLSELSALNGPDFVSRKRSA